MAERNVGEVEVKVKLDVSKKSVAAAEAQVRTFGERIGKNGALQLGRSFSKFLFPEMALGMRRTGKLVKAAAGTFIIGALANTLISGTRKIVHGVGALLALIPAALVGVGLSVVALKEGFEDLGSFLSRRFSKDWQQIERRMGRNFMRPLIDDVLRMARHYLPLLSDVLGDVATAWGNAFGDIAGWLTFPSQIFKVKAAFDSLKIAIDNVAGAIPFIFAGLFPLFTIGSNLLAVFSVTLRDLSYDFYRFMRRVEASGQLQDWILRGIDGLRQLWETFKQVVRIAVDLGAALENVFEITQFRAGSLLDVIEVLAQSFRDWTESASGQETIAAIWEELREYVSDIADGVKRLWEDGLQPLITSKEFSSFFKAWEDFRVRVWNSFIDTLIVLLRDVAPPLLQFFDDVISAIASVDDATGGAISKLAGIALAFAAIARIPGVAAIASAFGAIGGALGAILKPLGALLSRLPIVIKILDVIRNPILAFRLALIGLGNAVRTLIYAALGPLAAALGIPVAALAAIIVAVIAVGVVIYIFRDQVWAALQAVGRFFVRLWDTIYDNFVGPLIRFFTGPFVNFWQSVWRGLQGPIRIFMTVLRVIFNVLIVVVFGRLIVAVGVLVAVFRAAWPAISAVFRFILNAAMGLIHWIQTNWRNIITFIAGPIGIVVRLVITHWNSITRFFIAAWNIIRGAFAAAWHWIRDAVLSPAILYWQQQLVPRWQAVVAFFQAAWEMIRNAFAAAWHWIRDEVLRPAILYWQQQVIPRWQAVVDFFHSAWDAIRDTFSSAWHWIRDEVIRPFMDYWNQHVIPRMESVRDFFADLWDRIRRTAASIWDRIVSAVRGPVNAIIRIINGLIGGINSVIGLINNIPGVSIPRIPTIPTIGSGRGGGPSISRRAQQRAAARMGAPGAAMGTYDLAKQGPFKTHGPRAIVGEGDPRHPEYVIPTDPRFRGRAVSLFSMLANDLGIVQRRGLGRSSNDAEVQHLFLGGIIDSAKDAIGSALDAVGGFVQGVTRQALRTALDPVNDAARRGLNQLPNPFHLRDIAHGIRKTIYRVLTEGVGGALPEDDPAAAPTGRGGAGLSGNPAANRRLGMQLNAQRGWSSHWAALDALVMSESGWRNTAQNPTSTAYGIGQFLNSTWAGVGYRKTSDPRTQILAMLEYIARRYGNPSRAWAFKRSHNWYAGGGVVPGMGAKLITAHGREMILNMRQQAALFRMLDTAYRPDLAAGAPGGGAITINNSVNITFNVTGAASKEEADRQLRPYLDVLEERRVLNAARLP